MLMNLFSSFNPSSSFFNSNWLSLLIIIFMFPNQMFLFQSRMTSMFKIILNNLMKEMFPFIKSLINMNFLLTLFMIIFMVNISSLLPFIFTPSAHMSITLSLSFPLWLTLMIYGWTYNTKFMFSHLTPQNTPSLLIPLMVMIESISLMIRPLTLSIRLTTNMITGHLLLTLLNSMLMNISLIPLTFLIPVQMILILLETAVALIQAYIFMTLMILYSSEIN